MIERRISMKRLRPVILAGALALAAAPVVAQTSTTSPETTPSVHSDLNALQDARITLASLAEESMPQDMRVAFDRLSANFRTLYSAYTGHEPDGRESTAEAAWGKVPASDWRGPYDALTRQLDLLIGPAAHGSRVATDMSKPVRDGLTKFKDELNRFSSNASSPRH
jgi:hypothetical protein